MGVTLGHCLPGSCKDEAAQNLLAITNAKRWTRQLQACQHTPRPGWLHDDTDYPEHHQNPEPDIAQDRCVLTVVRTAAKERRARTEAIMENFKKTERQKRRTTETRTEEHGETETAQDNDTGNESTEGEPSNDEE